MRRDIPNFPNNPNLFWQCAHWIFWMMLRPAWSVWAPWVLSLPLLQVKRLSLLLMIHVFQSPGHLAGLSSYALKCGRLSVPLAYANPVIGMVSLSILRLLADPRKRRDSLFTNPGGPGVQRKYSRMWALGTGTWRCQIGYNQDMETMRESRFSIFTNYEVTLELGRNKSVSSLLSRPQ